MLLTRYSNHKMMKLKQLFPTVSKRIRYKLYYNQSDKFTKTSTGVKDCEVFFIAFATAIAFGQNPATQMFQQQSMRAHLINCFENKMMTPFP